MDKTDSTGQHSLLMDGASAGSPILYDTNTATYFTPGLSENDNGTSKYYHADVFGSTRGMTDAGQNPTDGLAVKPLYELYNASVKRHIYTDDPDEYNRPPSGYAQNGTVCYLISNTATTQYDLNGNVVAATDANGHGVSNMYDADDRLTQSTNARGDTTKYTYGEDPSLNQPDPRHGLLAYKTNGNGKQTHYAYTARNEVAQVRYPLQQGHGQTYLSEYFTYDGNGNLKQRTKRDNHRLQYTYDAANRLTDIAYPDSTVTHGVHFTYDAADRRTSMIDGTGTTTWAYENNNLLQQIASPQGTVNYQHNDAANRLTLRYLGSGGPGQQWTYAYDAANRPQSLTGPDGPTTYYYDPTGRVGYYTSGNGVHTNFTYNAAGLVSAMSHIVNGTGPTLSYYVNAYDAVGNLLLRTEGDASSTAYTYDAIDQLMSETRTSPNSPATAYFLRYDYDQNYNRLHDVNASGTFPYTYDDDDELLSRAGSPFTYDNNGNQLTDGTSTETYDDEDRLLSWSGSGKFDQFYYNGLGLRVDKEDSAGSHSLLMDGSSPASPVLYDNLGAVVLTPGLSEHQGGVSKYYHADTLGSTRGMTNSSEQSTGDSFLFDAFGETVVRTGSTPTDAGYVGAAGYRTDGDTHLMMLGNRYYNPATGRFLTQDPAGAGDNEYVYVNNNPLKYIDPFGLYELDITVTEITTTSVSDDGGKTWRVTGQTSQIIDQYSINVPDGVDLFQNVREARKIAKRFPIFPHPTNAAQNAFNQKNWATREAWYVSRVMPYSSQDYKNKDFFSFPFQTNYQWDAAGNWNAGAEAFALGFSWPEASTAFQTLHRMFHSTNEDQTMQWNGYMGSQLVP